MELVNAYLPILIPCIVFSVFAYVYIGGKIRHPLESGLYPIFEEQVGGRFNQFNLTVPFVRHSIYEEFVVIAYGSKKHVLQFSEITKVTYTRYVLSKCLIYRHSNAGIPIECIIWSRNGQKAIEILGARGVSVEDCA